MGEEEELVRNGRKRTLDFEFVERKIIEIKGKGTDRGINGTLSILVCTMVRAGIYFKNCLKLGLFCAQTAVFEDITIFNVT